jgi:deoxyribodipyrimidine photo-lyase
MKGLVWLRNDLRIDDNPALRQACIDTNEVHCIYIYSSEQMKLHNQANCKIEFIINNLINLNENLKKLNIPLTIVDSKGFSDNPKKILDIVKERSISNVYWNNMFGTDESERDKKVKDLLDKENTKCKKI